MEMIKAGLIAVSVILVVWGMLHYLLLHKRQKPLLPDDMEGRDFEVFCARLLENRGFEEVEVTKCSGDYGVDILAEKGYRFVTIDELLNRNTGNGWTLDPTRIYCTMKPGDYSRLKKEKIV